MKNADLYPTIAFTTPQEWEAWLEAHGAESSGIWLKMAKKSTGIPSITYAEALESALCFGWIDGQKASVDETYWVQKFTPRRPKSMWSQVNRARVAALIAAGRMRPAGLAEVEAAKGDGRWDAAYASQRTSTVPDDFQAELDKNPIAKTFFATLDSANRYAVLYRIQTAKKGETRAARIQKLIAMLEEGKKIH